MDDRDAGGDSPPRKKHQLQPKIDAIFAKWSSLRKDADQQQQGDGARQASDGDRAGQQAAGAAGAASVIVGGRRTPLVGPSQPVHAFGALREYLGESEVDEEGAQDDAAYFKKGEWGAGDNGADADDIVVNAPVMEEVGWVQCERCTKWRSGRLELTSKLADEATPWMCEHNTWDAARATCDAPEEAW